MPKTIELKLYGSIGTYSENSARRWIDLLTDAIAKYDIVDIHLHSPGGEVIEGNLIYNLINNSDKVNVIVDGMAASMASILLQGGTVRKMVRNGYIMIHVPKGYTYGNAKQHAENAKLLETMEQSFVEIYGRSTAPESEIQTWLDGNDHWFTAQEALRLGFIDEIIEPVVRRNVEKEQVTGMQAIDVYNCFAVADNVVITQLKNQMDKNVIIGQLGLTNLSADSSDTAIMEAIQTKIAGERTARIAAETALAEERTKHISRLLDKAVANGLPADERAEYEKIGKAAGVEALAVALKSWQTPRKTITSQINGNDKPIVRNWKWYEEHDVEALAAMEDNDPEQFRELYEAEFGKKK